MSTGSATTAVVHALSSWARRVAMLIALVVVGAVCGWIVDSARSDGSAVRRSDRQLTLIVYVPREVLTAIVGGQGVETARLPQLSVDYGYLRSLADDLDDVALVVSYDTSSELVTLEFTGSEDAVEPASEQVLDSYHDFREGLFVDLLDERLRLAQTALDAASTSGGDPGSVGPLRLLVKSYETVRDDASATVEVVRSDTVDAPATLLASRRLWAVGAAAGAAVWLLIILLVTMVDRTVHGTRDLQLLAAGLPVVDGRPGLGAEHARLALTALSNTDPVVARAGDSLSPGAETHLRQVVPGDPRAVAWTDLSADDERQLAAPILVVESRHTTEADVEEALLGLRAIGREPACVLLIAE